MNIDLPEYFARRVQRYADPDRGITELDVLKKAMDRLEESEPGREDLTAEELQGMFREFRGTLDMTRDEVLDARREGIA